MTKHWIFVSGEYTDYSRGSIETVVKRIKRTGKWYIGPRTPHRNHVQRGDKIIIYQAGKEGKKFIGSATVHSELKVDEKEPFEFIVLSNVNIWEKPVEISSILDKLSFIKNKRWWRMYFRGGILGLPESDYRLLMRTAHKSVADAKAKVLERRTSRYPF